MTDPNPNISRITLYVNRPNNPIGRKGLSYHPSTKEQLYYTHRIHLKYTNTEKLKVKEFIMHIIMNTKASMQKTM